MTTEGIMSVPTQAQTAKSDKKISQKERVQEIRDQLVQGVKDLQTSDDFKAYLSARSKYHVTAPGCLLCCRI